MSEATLHENGVPPATPSPRQVLLGWFILFQLAFLVVSNLLGFVKWVPTDIGDQPKQRINQVLPQFADEQGHGWHWTDQLETCIRRWVQLTGQDQDWALFAPTVGKATGFPAVLFLWEEATPADTEIPGASFIYDARNGYDMQIEKTAARTELLLSENEPKDMDAFLRIGKCRVRRYEGQFWFNPLPHYDEEPEKQEKQEDFAPRLTRRVREMVKEYHDPIVEYLKWRLASWKSEHPDQPAPKQVIMLERFYRIHDPEEKERGWDKGMIPIARWLPKLDRKEHDYVLETFDFTDKRFVLTR